MIVLYVHCTARLGILDLKARRKDFIIIRIQKLAINYVSRPWTILFACLTKEM